MKDGWHTICNYDVYVQNNIILRGMTKDYNGCNITAFVYRWNKRYNCWVNEYMSVDAFRAGINRGTVKLS